jgi:putative spermidine/putrescine transport system permease protein
VSHSLPISERLRNHLLIAPSIVVVSAFGIIPLTLILLISFYQASFAGYVPVFTLSNYAALFSTGIIWKTFFTTLRLSGATVLLSFLLGYPIAYTLAYKVQSPRKRTFVLLMLVVPFLMDYSIRTLSWYPILGTNGIINGLLQQAGLTQSSLNLLFSESSLLLIWLQTYVLFMITPVYLALIKIQPSTVEAARTLGATSWQAFLRVTLPLSLPGIVVGAIYVLVSTISDYATPELFGGGIQTVGLEVAQRSASFLWPGAAALSAILIVIFLALSFLILRFVDLQQLFR